MHAISLSFTFDDLQSLGDLPIRKGTKILHIALFFLGRYFRVLKSPSLCPYILALCAN